MRVKYLYHLLSMCTLLSMFSCSSTYAPAGTTLPAFTQKGEAIASVNFGNYPRLGAAYAINENFYAVADFAGWSKQNLWTKSELYDHTVGLGGYWVGDLVQLEGHFGAGFGTANNCHYAKALFQPTVHFLGDKMNVSVSNRMSYIMYRNQFLDSKSSLRSDKDMFYLQPMITHQFGSKTIRSHIQLGLSFRPNTFQDQDFLAIINGGVTIDLHDLLRSKAQN